MYIADPTEDLNPPSEDHQILPPASAPVKLTGSTFFGPDFNLEAFRREFKHLISHFMRAM